MSLRLAAAHKSGGVIPALALSGANGKAGIQPWTPAFAGVTVDRVAIALHHPFFSSAANRHLRRSKTLLLACLVLSVMASAVVALPSSIPLNERVLIVYDKHNRDSKAVARYYASRRNIPQANECGISPWDPVSLNWDQFLPEVKKPIQKCLTAAGRKKILYIVFMYLTPYRLMAPGGPYALDQYVADIWDQYLPPEPAARPIKSQPYFADAESEGNVYAPFVSFADYRAQPSSPEIYSVWRLDAANASLAKGLVDKAIAAEKSGLKGQACFDRNRGDIARVIDWGYEAGDWDLHQAAEFAREAGFRVTEDSNGAEFGTPPAPNCPDAALYSGWYSLEHYNDAFTWNTGAIGFHLDSGAAVNLRGGPSWSANAIIKGITVTSGAVSEPYLEGMAHPDGVFRNLFQGANVGDAFVRNTRWLKWKILNLGDPLYRPFPGGCAPFNSSSFTESSFALLPQRAIGGTVVRAIVSLAKPAPGGGARVPLHSSDEKTVAIPDEVTIPEGATSAGFAMWTLQVPQETKIVISAGGAVDRKNTLDLYPLSAAR